MDVNSTVVNQVYYNEKAADVAVNLITENSNFDLYMDYPDNLVSEDNILVPPMNLIPSIKFLTFNNGSPHPMNDTKSILFLDKFKSLKMKFTISVISIEVKFLKITFSEISVT